MKNLQIESFYLANSTTELFPLATFVEAGTFGCFFTADFIFPFELNPEIFAQIQESLKRFIKEHRSYRVYEMLPKIAKDFLHHNHRPKIAQLIDLDSPMVSLVQIGEQFFVSDQCVSSESPSLQIKLFEFRDFIALNGRKVTRIYGLKALDSQGLKEQVKKVTPFFKRDLPAKLREMKLFDRLEKNLLLREKGTLFKQEILTFFKENLEVFGAEFVEGTKPSMLIPYAFVNSSSISIEKNEPEYQMLLNLITNPLFILEQEVGNQYLSEKILKFITQVIQWLEQFSFCLKLEVFYGSDFELLKTEIEKRAKSQTKNLKNRRKFSLTITGHHPLMIKSDLLNLKIEEKDQKNILKITANLHPVGVFSWIEDQKIGIQNG